MKIRINLGPNMSPRIKNKNKNKQSTNTTAFFGIKTWNIFLICLIILTGFLYLTQVNASAVKGYVIRDLEIQQEEIVLNSRKLELESQAMQSVGGIAAKVQELGMVTADEVEYFQLPGGEVAVAK